MGRLLSGDNVERTLMQVDSAHCGGVAKLIIEQNHLVSTSSQYCPHSTISPQVAYRGGVVKLVITPNQLLSTSSQHYPHSTISPHVACCGGVVKLVTEQNPFVSGCIRFSTFYPPMVGDFKRTYGHMGNYLVTCGEKVGKSWEISVAGYYMGSLCARY